MTADNRPVWVADAETDPFAHDVIPEPFIWGIYTGSEYYEFLGTGPAHTFTDRDYKKLVDFLAAQNVIIYAHNGGKFDWHFLSPYFEPESEILVIHGRLVRFKIGKCEFRDSYNLIPVPLEKYEKIKFDYVRMSREFRDQYMPEIREYLKYDCVSLWNLLENFISYYGRHLTQASAAMSYWQHTLKNKVPRSNSTFYDRFKPWYYGGRVQCFEFGDFRMPSKSADIASAYPHAMLSSHPYSLLYRKIEGMPAGSLDTWGPLFFCIECDSFGAFPYRATNNALYFPDDGIRRIYYVTGYELVAAIETDTIDNIKFYYHYQFFKTRDFSEYVNHFWTVREHAKELGDTAQDIATKLMLNSLYGKFGMDPRRHKSYTLHPVDALDILVNKIQDGDSIQDFREWLIFAQQKQTAKLFYNVATAASITGFVRAKLWRAICDCERPLYCDTDSITAIEFGNLDLGKNIGQWEIEYHYDRAIIVGKKTYAFHIFGKSESDPKAWKIACKGAELSWRDIARVAAGETITYERKAPTFSTTRKKPVFLDRDITLTAQDIRRVPIDIDPLYGDAETWRELNPIL